MLDNEGIEWAYFSIKAKIKVVSEIRELLTPIRAPNRTLLHEKLDQSVASIPRLQLLRDFLEPVHMGEKEWKEYAKLANREPNFIMMHLNEEVKILQEKTDIELSSLQFPSCDTEEDVPF